MKTENTELLSQIENLQAEIIRLKKRKKYGLVWEDKPEEFEEKSKNAFPILLSKKKKNFADLVSDVNDNYNILIEGDNYHSISVLAYTHREKIDVIYIDPPYNTGSTEWRYNNDYVGRDDDWRHSKWISFMKKRLEVSRRLLTESGFLVCAIDANELFSLGLLLDEVFGEKNRLGLVTVLHNPKGRNLSKFFSANSEFMLVYAKDINNADFNQVAISDEVKALFDHEDEDGSYRYEPFMRARTVWSRENRPKNWYPIYVSKNLETITHEKVPGFYEVLPITNNGKEMAWKNIKESFIELNKEGYFIAKKEDGKIRIYHKLREQQVYKNVWTDKRYQSEFHGTNLLKSILGENIFDYPKSLYLVTDILKIISRKDSIILDFFAGSGTTGHAVLALNKEDGGNRSFILCTNNENGICEEVTYERVKRVITGYQNSRGEKVQGLGGNLKYLKTDYLPKDAQGLTTDEDRLRLTYEAGLLLALKENTFDELEKNESYQIFGSSKKKVGVYFSENKKFLQKFLERMNDDKKESKAYIFSWDKGAYKNAFPEYSHITFEDIPEPILEVYKQLV